MARNPFPNSTFILQQKKNELASGGYRQWQSLVQEPPLPSLRPRRGVLPPAACASAYTIEPVCLWDPSIYFNDTEVCCWHCKKKGVITHAKDVELKGWTNGKTIDDIKRPFRFYAKRMRCKVCKKNSQSDDEGFIEMFGPRATLFFQQQCGHHSHNVSADLEDGGWKHHIYSTTTSAC